MALSVVESMTLATGMSAINTAVERWRAEDSGVAETAGEVAKVVAAGAIVTVALLAFERVTPLARSFAVLLLVTSALVNGVRLADTAIQATT